jgi:hypothetical protein
MRRCDEPAAVGGYASATTTITQASSTATIVSAWLEISKSYMAPVLSSGLDAAWQVKV